MAKKADLRVELLVQILGLISRYSRRAVRTVRFILEAPNLGGVNIDALRGGVEPKSYASVRTVCFFLEAPCLGD